MLLKICCNTITGTVIKKVAIKSDTALSLIEIRKHCIIAVNTCNTFPQVPDRLSVRYITNIQTTAQQKN